MNEPSPFAMVSSPLMHELAEEIIKRLYNMKMRMPHYCIDYTTFANGEHLPQIPQTIRGQHVFLLHALQHPDPNNAIMKMLLSCDAMRRASAAGITLVVPYIPYLRQDRKDKPRVPISARMIADLIESNKAVKQLITMDMHAEQEQGFFSIPVDNLTGVRLFSEHILERYSGNLENTMAIAADFGAAVRTRRLALALGEIPVGIIEKRRTGPNQSEILSVIGDCVKYKRVIIYEDIIDTGGTILKVVGKLNEFGASEIVIYATHSIFSKQIESRFAAEMVSVVTTDSIPRQTGYYEEHKNWLTKISTAEYLSEAIFEATQLGGSISKLHSKPKGAKNGS